MNPSNLLQKHLKRFAIIPPHSIGVVAVSGGADSMALLHALTVLQRKRPFSLYAATFDHGLRGTQSAQEAVAVAAACAQWGIPHLTGSGDLDPHAPAVEARARAARYAFLASITRQIGADWVATGHHADDQAETVLMHLIRGAGLRGLRGMLPVTSLPNAPAIPLLRPFLGVHRSEITAYCEHNHIPYHHDPTNDDVHYKRNWVRHVALPTLAQVNPHITTALTRLATAAALDDQFLDSLTDFVRETAVVSSGQVAVSRPTFAALHLALRVRVIAWASEVLGASEPPTFEQLHHAASLADGATGGRAELSGRMSARLEHDAFILERAHITHAIDGVPGGFGLTAGTVYPLGIGLWQTFPDGTAARLVKQTGVGGVEFYVPSGQAVTLRTPIRGERIKPASLGGHSKRLKAWLIDHKIPQRWRDRLPIIAVGETAVALWDGSRWHSFWSDKTPDHALSIR